VSESKIEGMRDILLRYGRKEISIDEAMRQMKLISFRKVGEMAKIDPNRADRIDVPEAILAEGKSVLDLVSISLAHLEERGRVIITRVSDDQLRAIEKSVHQVDAQLDWNTLARTAVIWNVERKETSGKVGILTAGTADIPVAEEARIAAFEMGCDVTCEYDVGVAGIHRLFPSLEKMIDLDCLVVAAGREGTLPAIVAGLVDVPVIGLPVSSGYGAGGDGIAALLSMLQSCSVLSVVNIDAGFVAGAFAAKVANRSKKK